MTYRPAEKMYALIERLIDWACLGFLIISLLSPVISTILHSVPKHVYTFLVTPEALQPKIDTSLFAVSTTLFLFIVICGILIDSYSSDIKQRIALLQRPLAYAVLIWIMITVSLPNLSFYSLPFILLTLILFVIQTMFIRKRLPFLPLSILIIGVLLRHVIPQILLFDKGEIGMIFPAVAVILLCTKIEPEKTFGHWQSLTPWLLGITGGIVAFLAISPHFADCFPTDYDIYFTMLPAYHILHGGVPLTNAISQYGLLYLAPWVAVFKLFPLFPLAEKSGAFIAFMLLIGYFSIFGAAIGKMFKNPLVGLGILCAAVYYAILVRFYAFPDPYVETCAPAFTPLRFGLFIIPLIPLLLFTTKKSLIYFYLFAIFSTLCLFFSFDVGFTTCIVGWTTVAIYTVLQKNPLRLIPKVVGVIITSIIAPLIGYCIWSLYQTGRLPDISLYLLFTKMYSNGYYFVLLNGSTIFVPQIVFSVAGFFIGGYLLLKEKNNRGLVYIYTSLCQLTLLLYFLGRSLPAPLYTVSLPMIVLCGLIIDFLLSHKDIVHEHLWYTFLAFTGGFLLLSGSFHTIQNIAQEWHNPSQTWSTFIKTVHVATTEWDIFSLPQYKFLSENLPLSCPIVLFDFRETELLTALHATPAFEYPFITYFILTKEQVDDTLRRHPNGFCVFINHTDMASNQYALTPIYTAIWDKLSTHAKLLKADSTNTFELYSIQ